MKSEGTQLDLYRHSPRFLAAAFREAARTERRNPYYSPADGEKRAAWYEAQAIELEQRA